MPFLPLLLRRPKQPLADRHRVQSPLGGVLLPSTRPLGRAKAVGKVPPGRISRAKPGGNYPPLSWTCRGLFSFDQSAEADDLTAHGLQARVQFERPAEAFQGGAGVIQPKIGMAHAGSRGKMIRI